MQRQYEKPPSVRIADADKSAFFASGLEYNTPARGMWNIVHMAMLVPEAHQVYVCAQGCLRGVILTAAEMNALDRMSWISVSEADMYDGTLETDIIDGTAEIMRKLKKQPPVVMLTLSCIHLFAGCDFEMILRELHEQFPETVFVDCYMTPTMRTTISPVVKMNAQIYAALPVPEKIKPKAVNIIGCDRATDSQSELVKLIGAAGWALHEIQHCRSFAEYQGMAESALNITYIPAAKYAGETLAERLGTAHLYLPVSFDYDEIAAHYHTLCDALHIACPDFSAEKAAAEQALSALYAEIGNIAIAIDFTAVTRPFELAWLLISHGMQVKYIIADAVGEDGAAYDKLKAHCPELEIFAATNVNMLHHHETAAEPVLAIGQKAAYYFAADRFVNIVTNGGYYGFSGICAIAGLLADAYRNPKDRKAILRHKGFGCESCLM